MRLIKSLMLVVGIVVFFGAFFLLMDGGTDSEAQAELGKPAMWGDDVLVHTGWVSRYPRNGYSADYFDDSPTIYAAVTCHSSGPDTCRFYASTDGGQSWFESWPSHYASATGADISNPQMVVGEGANPYILHFVLDQNLGEIILVRRFGFSLDTITISDGNKGFVATRDDPSDQNYYLHMARATDAGEVVFSYSTNYGANWQIKDTVDGDMPHIATAGPDGEDLYLTWRLDGENGAFYGACARYDGLVAKNVTPGIGSWKYLNVIDTTGGASGASYCLLQASDGAIYTGMEVGIGGDVAVFKSEDGGKVWMPTGDLGDQKWIYDFLEAPVGTIYVATGKYLLLQRGAKVYRTTDGGKNWTNTGNIGGIAEDFAERLARNPISGHIYVGTGDQGDLFRTQDGGETWYEVGELTGLKHFKGLIVTHSRTILAGGEGDDSLGIFRSPWPYGYWDIIRPKGVKSVLALFQASDNTIYAGVLCSGDVQKILKSIDDGASWTWSDFSSSGVCFCFVEGPNSYMYASDGHHIYRSIDQGDTWTEISGSPSDIVDLIHSKHQILVKKSTNHGVTWGDAEKLTGKFNDKSDPKVAGVYTSSPTKAVWVAYSEKNTLGDWNLKYAYSTGTNWSKNHTLAGGSGSDKQLCDLGCFRGNNTYLHAAYCSDETGSRKLYYRWASNYNPTDWSDTLRISGVKPTLAHTPEICFYQGDPVVFFSWGYGLKGENPKNLYVNAQEWTSVEEVQDGATSPPKFSLSQNYPNPFNPVTSIQYAVTSRQTAARTTLKIYNIKGQLVRTLVDEPKEVGNYQIIWDGKSDNGKDVASGIYLYELKVGDYSQTKKMVFLK